MNTELLNDLVEECNAALQVSIPEGREAINATARMIEGVASVFLRHDKSFNRNDFLKKIFFPLTNS